MAKEIVEGLLSDDELLGVSGGFSTAGQPGGVWKNGQNTGTALKNSVNAGVTNTANEPNSGLMCGNVGGGRA